MKSAQLREAGTMFYRISLATYQHHKQNHLTSRGFPVRSLSPLSSQESQKTKQYFLWNPSAHYPEESKRGPDSSS